MFDVFPMFHMDEDYMWRWYVTDAWGDPLFMSAKQFFNYEDARWDFDATFVRFRSIRKK